MSDLKFGIILPTYNRPELLKRAIASVCDNDYEHWIVVVVDDGSTVDNEDVIELFDDDRIVYIRLEKNSGVNKARNVALSWLLKSDCDYIGLLDDDDQLLPQALSQVSMIISEYPELGWYVFNAIDDKGQKITQAKEYKPMYYLSYLVEENLTGDAPPFISKKLLSNSKFSTKIINGKEVIFFLSIKSKMYLFDCDVILRVYYDGGLTSKEKSLLQATPSWRIALKKAVSKVFIKSLMKIVSPYTISKYLVKIYEKYYQLKMKKLS